MIQQASPSTFLTRLLVLAAGAAPGLAQSAPTFSGPFDFDLSESDPQQALTADFDHDGLLDLAVTTTGGLVGDGRLDVLFGDGTGDFSVKAEYTAGFMPAGLAAGDFDGDTFLDLVVCEGGSSDKVHVFLNDGAGGFAPSALLTASAFPIDAATGDFDGDGLLDLVVAMYVGPYDLVVYLGNGDGTFGAGSHVDGAVGLHGTCVAVGDLTGDGHLDLALSHFNGVRVFKGLGDGSFASSASAPSSVLTESVALGDVDGDGLLDLASVELYASVLRVWHGNGDGSFTPIGAYPTASNPRDAVLADVDGDGRMDISVPAQLSKRVSIYLGLAGGGFGAPVDVPTGFEPMAVAVGDWNGDGRADLAVPLRNLGATAVTQVFLQDPAPPRVYCTAKVNSQGCTPAIGFSGAPSQSGGTFTLSAVQVLNNEYGILFYGHGAAAAPFQGGTLCVAPPTLRTPAQLSGGNPPPDDCSGHYAYDFGALIHGGTDPALVAGAWTYAQYWTRDPLSPSTTGLTDAVGFLIAP